MKGYLLRWFRTQEILYNLKKDLSLGKSFFYLKSTHFILQLADYKDLGP